MRTNRLFFVLLAFVFFAAGCSVNPATGRRQFDMLSTEEEVALGSEAMPELVKEYGGEVESAALRDYVTGVGLKMTKFTEADGPDLPWEFTVLDSDVINAFALPGGKVFISRGLMDRFTNEAQLAGVLGHEIGHVTAQHIDERISQAMGIEVLAQVAGAAAGDQSVWAQAVPVIVGLGGQGYLLKFGRDQERESDILGMRYMVKAGYDPHGMYEVMEILAEASEGSGGPPEFLSTHPHPETRLATIKELLAGEYAYTQDNPEFGKYDGRWEREAAPYLKK